MTPVVSVVMAVYNGEKYLAEAIESILGQNLENFEFLVVDDGSTDATSSILEEYARRDSRIRILTNERNRERCFSRNRAIESARGEFIALMDADDVALPERLQKQVDYLQSHSDAAAVSSFVESFDERGRISEWKTDRKTITAEDIRATMPKENCYAQPAAMVRTAIMRDNPYREGQTVEDWDLWLRLLAAGHRLEKLPEVLLRYRMHGENTTQKWREQDRASRLLWECRSQFLAHQLERGLWGEFERMTLRHYSMFFLQRLELRETPIHFPRCFKMPASEVGDRDLVITFRKIDEGGVERVITTWANEFAKRDYEVTILTDAEPSANDYPISSRVRRVAMSRSEDYLERFYEFVEGNAAAVYIINDDYTELCYRKMLLLKILGKRVIVVNHGVWYVPAHPNARWRPAWELRPAVFSVLDAVVCLSLVDKAYWNWAGLKNVLYIPNPIPFENKADKRSTQEHPLIVWIGRFSKEKQPELMIDLFAQIRRRVPDARLCMLGNGDLLEQCRKKADKMGLSGTASFPGFVDDVGSHLRQAAVHCITSQYEGFPVTWLEAKSFGVPTVLFRLSNVEMSSAPGAISVNKYDKSAFVEETVRLLTDLASRNKIGNEAFRSLSEFSNEKVFGRWELLFRSLSAQEKCSYEAFAEKCPPERLNDALFDQTIQLLDDWVGYSYAPKPDDDKGTFQLTQEYLSAVLKKKFPSLLETARIIRKRVKK